jgi:hypothetical protein
LSGDVTFHDAGQLLLLVITGGRARLAEPESLLGTGSVLVVPRDRALALRSAEQLKVTWLAFEVAREHAGLGALRSATAARPRCSGSHLAIWTQ